MIALAVIPIHASSGPIDRHPTDPTAPAGTQLRIDDKAPEEIDEELEKQHVPKAVRDSIVQHEKERRGRMPTGDTPALGIRDVPHPKHDREAPPILRS